MMKSESDIERRHKSFASRAGWLVVKLEKTTPKGFPDRFYAKDGRVVLIEWKAPTNGRSRAQQRLRHKQLRAAGIEVHTVYSVEEANRILGLEDGKRRDAHSSSAEPERPDGMGIG